MYIRSDWIPIRPDSADDFFSKSNFNQIRVALKQDSCEGSVYDRAQIQQSAIRLTS